MATVGIIGGGGAGLCAARQVLATGTFKPIVWELATGIGGTWRYNSKTGKDENGLPIHSSMYQNMKTNLPKEVMGFPDFPFPKDEDSFVHHTKVVNYLQEYADHFDLNPWIKYESFVEKVEPVPQETGLPKWSVTIKDLKTGTFSKTICEAVIVCNGHYSLPRVPKLEGIEDFKGRQMHSHDYREPTPFKGATVIVLGAGASGLDISLEISQVAKQVILSHNLPVNIKSELPANMTQEKGAISVSANGFRLLDGSTVEADFILYCTGYQYSFPFLSEECGIQVENNQVKPLYKHLINTVYPSMAFLGIPFQICPFPFFDFQSRFFMKAMAGEMKLPSRSDMDAEIQEEHEERVKKSIASKYFHNMNLTQWQYTKDMADLAGLETTLPVIEKLFTAVRATRNQSLMTYKQASYVLTGPETYECIR